MDVRSGIPYGTQYTVLFELWELDDSDLQGSPGSFVAGDVKLSKDGGPFVNTTNLPTQIGTNGVFTLVLTATEMEFKEGVLRIVDSATKQWRDRVLLLQTASHPAAFDPRDVIHRGTLQTGGINNIVLATTAPAIAGYFIGATIRPVAGAGAGQPGRTINGYTTGRIAALDKDFVVALDGTTVVEIIGTPPPPDFAAVDVRRINGSQTVVENWEAGAETIVFGAATGTPTTTVIPTNLTETRNDQYKDRDLIWRTGTLKGQRKTILAYNGATKQLTTEAFTAAPAATDEFAIL